MTKLKSCCLFFIVPLIALIIYKPITAFLTPPLDLTPQDEFSEVLSNRKYFSLLVFIYVKKL